MEIHRIPVLRDNYIFLLHDPATATAAIVDPAIAPPVLAKLQELGATLTAIFNTHHHWDHVDGNEELEQAYPEVVIYGGVGDRGRIPGQQVFLEGGDRVFLGDQTFEVLFIPGHTRAHIAYVTPGHVFCGDTLFAGGCGRLREGTPAQMMASLEQLRQLPGETQVWCAHEYTQKNLEFALTVEPENVALQERYQGVIERRKNHESTIPTTIALEKATNPFLRWHEPAIQSAVNGTSDLQTFTRLRGLKDQF
ncbi:hydroxyacylglutathione hydrolase [Candidatus Synechococcus calcipolaris G9]|uniref:Hydroxyacylglutathione hydrolase n=1 Tax=Candidatus Synechococcus calcipolaris G9 TaxID=1497997 RepID=A0ABT6EXB0_9SYNE|nr:hydroxyacylglutathione hydrolase [Candidatus Synechococcus calcipolaris]MDG2990416.1 hydroxyacylglutathione hydrolase [Candidatus Synechococcus calcipolaris G9]